VLVDMTKTASDFKAAASKALEALADGLLPKLRPILDELGVVRLTTLLCNSVSLCICDAMTHMEALDRVVGQGGQTTPHLPSCRARRDVPRSLGLRLRQVPLMWLPLTYTATGGCTDVPCRPAST
jgi:hypothetical protein